METANSNWTRGEVTQLLVKAKAGDGKALEEVIKLVYPQLRRLAAYYMQRERTGHTLQPTALVNEAYLRLVDDAPIEWKNRAHFMAVAAQAMRRILVDHARARNAAKRGGELVKDTIDDRLAYLPQRTTQILELNEALARLEQSDALKARIVEMRFFGGLSVEEIAGALQTAPRTVKRYWAAARARLYKDMSERRNHASGRTAAGG